MKKILLTGGNGMLAYDFIRTQCEKFEIVSLDKDNLDITKPREIEKIILEIRPDIILNCAAYTNVDESEDVGMKANFDINTLGTTYLAHAANRYGIDFITISTDYVFDGRKEDGYNENDIQNPINSYGLAKYLGEKLTREAYPNSIIVRTSWLYGGELYGSRKEMGTYKNFVNTMLRLSGNQNELKIIDDQFGSPTYAVDLSKALGEIIENITEHRGHIFHLSNDTPENGITWCQFTREIFQISKKDTRVIPCTTDEYKTKAVRPKYSKMRNSSLVQLRDWKDGLEEYIRQI